LEILESIRDFTSKKNADSGDVVECVDMVRLMDDPWRGDELKLEVAKRACETANVTVELQSPEDLLLLTDQFYEMSPLPLQAQKLDAAV